MSKTHRTEPTEPTENQERGNQTPASVAEDDRREACLEEADLRYFATRTAPATWSATTIAAMAKRCEAGPWRELSRGFFDWGALPGTTPGACQRFYFSGGAMPGAGGTVVADSARAVRTWLRDEHRAYAGVRRDDRPVVSTDVRLLAAPT